jgi:hypothetical protein
MGSGRFRSRVAIVCGLSSAGIFSMTLSACGGSLSRAPAPRPRPPEPIAVAPPGLYAHDTKESLEDICRIDPAACPTLDMERERARPLKEQVYAVQVSGSRGIFAAPAPAAPAAPPQPIEVGKSTASRAEMIDVEARVAIEVEAVASALGAIRALVGRAGGQLVNEVIENQPGSSGAALSIRVPSPQVHAVVAELERVGKLLSRKVESKDVGREYHDAQILARNLNATLERYEELLKKANDPREMLAIEEELARVRTEIDRIQGDIRYLSDRASRATIYVTLTSLRPDSDAVEPDAKLFVGLRASLPLDFSDAHGARTFGGGGLSLMPSRAFSIDADWATRLKGSDGIQLFLITAGSDLYSDRLGAGKRSTFNPYIGLRLGYARLLADDAFVLGGTLGVELYKSKAVAIDLEARAYGLLGLDDRTHALIQPGTAIHFAY